MARPLAFDPSRARAAALARFWQHGYQATSLADLTEAMAISRSSFYAAWGDKRALFAECLDSFAVQTLALLDALADRHPPLDAVRRFVTMDSDTIDVVHARWGCLLVNTSLETAGFDSGLRDHARTLLDAIEARLAALLRRAGLPNGHAGAQAAYLMTVVAGLRVAARRGDPAVRRAAITDTALQPVLAVLADQSEGALL